MSDSSRVLERFHRALVEEIQTQRPEYLAGPFTVAEIYQNLVPYGTHRERIGVTMNGDYEDALLRLLAGEGGYLILESEPALRDLRAELETPNPNTGLYREYAAVDVRLNQAHLDMEGMGPGEAFDLAVELGATHPIAMADLAPSEASSADEGAGVEATAAGAEEGSVTLTLSMDASEGAGDAAESVSRDAASEESVAKEFPGGAGKLELVPPGVDVFQEASARRSADGGDSCAWCRAELPPRENRNFCPFCGTDLKLVPCPSCGEELEPEWRFCISCGTEAVR